MASTPTHVVLVAFEVYAESRGLAEQIVNERLTAVSTRLLWQNDSNDIVRGTIDPIHTFDVVPLDRILRESL